MREALRRWLRRLFFGVCFTPFLLLAMTVPWLRATSLGDVEQEPKVRVLNYHKVDDMNISLSIRPQDFAQQMAWLASRGFHTITATELADALAGKASLPENPVLLTFDDGYEDNYKNAFPILKQYGFKATLFAIAGFVSQRKGYLTWDELKDMQAHGVDIESHTMTHRSLTGLSDEGLHEEIFASKQLLESQLGKEVHFFAYPTGTYNLHIASLVQGAGYRGAFTVKYANVDPQSNAYALERIPVFHTENTEASFQQRMRYLPVFASTGWVKN